MAGLNNPLLANSLQSLRKYYDNPDLEEVAVNRPGEIWCKYRSKKKEDGSIDEDAPKGWVPFEDETVSEDYVRRLCQKLANLNEQPFVHQGIPILSCTLPGGHRFQAIIGPNVRYDHDDTRGVALAIRLFSSEKRVTIKDFGLSFEHGLTETQDTHHEKRRYADNPLEDLIGAIDHGEAVLISGATATGKTSFLNDLVEYIPLSRRIITVEDAREVMLSHKNRVHLLAARTDSINKVGYSEILDVVVRMTPDVLIAGEISMKNAAGVHRLMTTGHTNFMATIHASSPEEAVKGFYQNLAQSNPGIDAQAAMEIIKTAFGRIVQIDRFSGRRVVTAIDIPGIVDEVAKEVVANRTLHSVPGVTAVI